VRQLAGGPFKPGFGLSGAVMQHKKAKAPRVTRGFQILDDTCQFNRSSTANNVKHEPNVRVTLEAEGVEP
jgi:hypothetical protein